MFTERNGNATSEDVSREKFESFWMTRGIKSLAGARESLSRDSNNDYYDESTQRHWWTWQNAMKCLTSQS